MPTCTVLRCLCGRWRLAGSRIRATLLLGAGQIMPDRDVLSLGSHTELVVRMNAFLCVYILCLIASDGDGTAYCMFDRECRRVSVRCSVRLSCDTTDIASHRSLKSMHHHQSLPVCVSRPAAGCAPLRSQASTLVIPHGHAHISVRPCHSAVSCHLTPGVGVVGRGQRTRESERRQC